VVIDLQGLLRSALISRGARSRRVVGMSDAREGASRFYDEIAPIREGHAVDRYAQVLDYLGVARGMPRFALPSAGVHPLPDLKAPYFVVHPFSRWPTKELPARLVSDIAVALHPAPVVVVGRGQWTGGEGVVDLTNATSLPSLLALLAGARGVVSSDSGPLHLAAALGVPLVAVFGPTSPGKTGPWTPNSRVLQLSLPCVPCASRVCRNAEPMACLEQISAARVVGALHECLAAVGGGP
jgi:ADP-heptose:LPS heptosyltransferase